MTQSPAELFKIVAPSYDASFMLARFEKTFADIEPAKRDLWINEFLKFMFLRSLYGKGFIPLMGDVDDVWHDFILQTQEYEKFCQALPGKTFIHHNSVHLDEFCQGKDKKEVILNLLTWLPNYYCHFGKFSEETAQCWMIVGFLQQELGLSLEEINQIAEQESARTA